MPENEAVIIVDVLEQKELFKFSSYEEVNEFCTTLKKGMIVKIYVPDKIAMMEVK